MSEPSNAFPPLSHVVHKLKNAQVERGVSLMNAPMRTQPTAQQHQLQSMDRSLCPPLLQNPACAFPRTRLLSEGPVGKGTPPVHNSTKGACDLRFAPSPDGASSLSADAAGLALLRARLPPITYTSPSAVSYPSVTLGLRFLRDPTRYAIRWHLLRCNGRVRIRLRRPVAMLRIRRRCFPPGFCGSAYRSVVSAAGALSCAFWLQRISLLRWSWSRWLHTPSLALPIDAC